MIREESADSGSLLQGTLEMLVLKALARGPQHGYAVAEWIHQVSHQLLKVEEGALYPALHRLELRGDPGRCEMTIQKRRVDYRLTEEEVVVYCLPLR